MRDIHSYLFLVEQRPDVRDRCRQCLLVTISRFFRDRRLWDYLQARLLPELNKLFPEGLHAWSAGCAGGEEPYSLAMVAMAGAEIGSLILRISEGCGSRRPTSIPDGLERARHGIYDAGSLKEVPDDLRQRFFIPLPRHAVGNHSSAEDCIDWELRDFLDELPRSPWAPFTSFCSATIC